jgi:hypothetical protein
MFVASSDMLGCLAICTSFLLLFCQKEVLAFRQPREGQDNRPALA